MADLSLPVHNASPPPGALTAALADPTLYEALFDRLPFVVFYVKDRDGRYVAVNDALVTRCGAASKRDVLGKTAREVFNGSLGETYAEQDRVVLAVGRPLHLQLEQHPYRDGTRGWCVTEKLPLCDESGHVVGLVGLSRDIPRAQVPDGALAAVADALAYAREHLNQPLRVADLATRAQMTTARFERLVGRLFGVTPRQLVQQLRLEYAAQMLVQTDATIIEVALACGYADHSAFTRAFRGAIGTTPSRFRSERRGATHSIASSPGTRLVADPGSQVAPTTRTA